MGSEQNRFPQQERRKRWGGCFPALSCFGSQKGGKRIVPAARVPEANASAGQPNGPQAPGMANQTIAVNPSLLAPPSSPASFTNSALPSTAQSPNCFLSLSTNSPGGPSNTMFATGPYAHETQLVTPPVFSTFTTEPSTAPLTPPPELAHLTTPSSPDVPYARFLTSSVDLKSTEKSGYLSGNDLQSTYSLYPGSPASTHRSPISRTSGNCSRSDSGNALGHNTVSSQVATQETNFFCPDTFAKFYLDYDSPFPQTGGRLSVSKDSDVYPSSAYQSKPAKPPKQDVEELEAYRASFGFSADEIITTSHYVEITDVADDSFTMAPLASSDKPSLDVALQSLGQHSGRAQADLLTQKNCTSGTDIGNGVDFVNFEVQNAKKDHKPVAPRSDIAGSSTSRNHIETDEEDLLSRMGSSRASRNYHLGMSCSDAEIEYRRGRSLRERKGEFGWRN